MMATAEAHKADKTEYAAALEKFRKARKRHEAIRLLEVEADLEAAQARRELEALELEPGFPRYIHEELTPTPEECSLVWCKIHPRGSDEEPF